MLRPVWTKNWDISQRHVVLWYRDTMEPIQTESAAMSESKGLTEETETEPE